MKKITTLAIIAIIIVIASGCTNPGYTGLPMNVRESVWESTGDSNESSTIQFWAPGESKIQAGDKEDEYFSYTLVYETSSNRSVGTYIFTLYPLDSVSRVPSVTPQFVFAAENLDGKLISYCEYKEYGIDGNTINNYTRVK